MNQTIRKPIAFALMWGSTAIILLIGMLLLYFMEDMSRPYLGIFIAGMIMTFLIFGLITWKTVRNQSTALKVRVFAKIWAVLILGASIAGLFFVRPELEQAYHCNDLMKIETPTYPIPPSDRIWQQVNSGPTPVTNPLKGFVAWKGIWSNFPHSMEFFYLDFRALVPGDSMASLNLTKIDQNLDEIASRGHQTVFRIHMDYPGTGTIGIPQFLIDEGVIMHNYTAEGGGVSPDYDDPRTVNACVQLIEALGAAFDGDPRIGYIQAGLLGHWGEWHTWPDSEWMANETTQRTILAAYNQAFQKTWVLARYPSPITKEYRVGFHDDMFSYNTLPVTDRYDDWYFWVAMEHEGMTDVWKTAPIGGEISPPIQATLFDCPRTEAQDFLTCVKTTHATWQLYYKIFLSSVFTPGTEVYQRAERGSAVMGYDMKACWMNTTRSGDGVDLSVIVENFGVAPFYYSWTVEFAVMDGDHNVLDTIPTNYSIGGILPDTTARWDINIPHLSLITNSTPIYALRVVNPLPNGMPVLFSNEKTTPNGWIILN